MTLVAGSGSEQLAALAARLKAQGDKTIRPQLLQGLKVAAKPCAEAAKAAATLLLPHGGGLNLQVAGQKVTVSVRTGARTAGIRMNTTAPDTKQTDSGYVRHPVFAHGIKVANGATKGGRARFKTILVNQQATTELKWVTQQIPQAEGWWSGTLAHSAPLVEPELTAVMERISAQIQGGI